MLLRNMTTTTALCIRSLVRMKAVRLKSTQEDEQQMRKRERKMSLNVGNDDCTDRSSRLLSSV